MAFLKSDADAIRTAIAEAVRDTLARIDSGSGGGGNLKLRESADEKEKREKRERRESKRLQESGREAFMRLGMSKKEAKLAARGREFRG